MSASNIYAVNGAKACERFAAKNFAKSCSQTTSQNLNFEEPVATTCS